MKTEAEWYAAVGVPMGRWLRGGAAGSRATAMVRRGREFALLDLKAFEVFLAALSPRPWGELVTVARRAGVDQPSALVDLLREDGLLVRFGGEDSRDLVALRSLRLQTVGVGIGNDTDDPDLFVIADNRLRPLLTCDGLTYTVWAASDGRSIGDICDVLAESHQVGSDELMRRLLAALPQLLAAGVAFLDATPESSRP
jgi:hypothetical protein